MASKSLSGETSDGLLIYAGSSEPTVAGTDVSTVPLAPRHEPRSRTSAAAAARDMSDKDRGNVIVELWIVLIAGYAPVLDFVFESAARISLDIVKTEGFLPKVDG